MPLHPTIIITSLPNEDILSTRITTAMPPRGPSKRSVQQTAELTSTPPDELTPTQQICKVVKANGNNLYNCETVEGKVFLAELPTRFRSKIWMKRGGYVVVDFVPMEERKNKIEGEIVNVVREEKAWRKMSYW